MFVTKAKRGKNDWWRYVLVLLALILVMTLAQSIALFALPVMYPDFDVMQLMNGDITEQIDKNVIYFFLVLPFAVAFLAMSFLIPLIHERPFASLFEPFDNIQWLKPVRMGAIFLVFLLVFEGINYFIMPDDYIANYAGWPFWVTVLISVFLLYFQTGWEELVFRSYVYQGLGILLGYRWLAVILSALLFAVMHMANPETLAYDIKMLFAYYLLTGVFLGVLVVMEDNIYLAWAFHFANNFVAAVFFSYEGAALNTYALFKTTDIDMTMLLPSSMISFIVLLVVLKYFRRWPDWRILWEPIGDSTRTVEKDSTII